MRKKIESKLDVGLIAHLNAKFEEKDWNKIRNYQYFLERFYNFIENLDADELDLVLEQIDEYEWITSNRYLDLLIDSLEKLERFKNLSLNTIYILPLLSRKDRMKNKEKSSRFVAYLCQNVEIGFIPLFSNTKFQIIDNLDHLPREGKINGNSNPIILVDDYVGTGETALEAIEEFFEYRDYNKNLVFILSLVAQKEGLKNICERGFNLIYAKLKIKGISNNFDSYEKESRLKLMAGLETKLKVDEEYKLGYKGSEALITLIRTPNNTFPIYWHETKMNNGRDWIAPFPRKK